MQYNPISDKPSAQYRKGYFDVISELTNVNTFRAV